MGQQTQNAHMTPEYDDIAPSTSRDLHTDEDRLGPNQWNIPLTPATMTPTTPSMPLANSQQPLTATFPIAAPRHTSAIKKWLIWLSIIVVVTTLGLFGAAQLYTFYIDRVTPTDLVTTSSPGGTFLRPKQWQVVSSSPEQISYGDKLASNNKSSAMLTVVDKKMATTSPLTSYTAAELTEIRNVMVTRITPAYLEKLFTANDTCISITNVNTAPGNTRSATSAEISSTTFDCQRNDGMSKATLNMSGDKNGYMHLLLVLAYKTNWEKNKDAYDKILNSAQPRSNS